jgi:hypothetical protein
LCACLLAQIPTFPASCLLACRPASLPAYLPLQKHIFLQIFVWLFLPGALWHRAGMEENVYAYPTLFHMINRQIFNCFKLMSKEAFIFTEKDNIV